LPTGVATQDRTRQRALVVGDKLERVANFHASTMHSLIEFTAAAGLDHPNEFQPMHFSRRVSPREVMTLQNSIRCSRGRAAARTSDPRFRDAWDMASAASFRPQVARAA